MRAPEFDSSRGNLIVLVTLIVVSIALTTVYSREGERGPLHQTRVGVLAVTAPLEQAGSLVAAPFNAVGSFFGGLAVSRSEVTQLRDQNEQLRMEVTQLQEQKLEYDRLTGLLGLKQALKLPSTAARVIGLPTNSWEGALVVDKGSAAGIRLGMPVVATEGLLGQIVEVSPNASKIRLITDRRSGVAAFVQRTRAPGIVRGSFESALSLDFVDRSFKTQPGDVAVTSGLGGVYPKGIVIGDVSQVQDERDKPYPQITVTSRVRIDELEEVLIITAPQAKPGVTP
jgi:rod shape-determining protein MreC